MVPVCIPFTNGSRWCKPNFTDANMLQSPHSPSVAVFTAGIAGLTVAHELATRGYKVRVFESNKHAGGFLACAHFSGTYSLKNMCSKLVPPNR